MRRLFLFLFILLVCSPLFAQKDTTFLSMDALKVENINENEDAFGNQKIVSASRSLQDVNDLPFTIYVITREEILAKGYNTLVDALKWVPGIRVSQPGSGLEGETFIMRGLQGNTYAKILINGVSIKPYATRGMPIGAQLPVREAERIEVIFGPAAAVYGADASAGVINIVMKDSDRPLYTQAEIGLGSDGFTSLHVFLGGKLGKGKRILKYSVFGSSTSFNQRRIYRDTGFLFNPSLYDQSGSYLDNLNYEEDLNFTPHLSRMVGFRLGYKDLNLTTMAMTRRDHSALGLNPTAVSYANPNNFIQDDIYSGHFDYSPNWGKWGMKLNLNVLGYRRNGISSTRYIENGLKNLFDRAIIQTSSSAEEISTKDSIVFGRIFSNDRYFDATSFHIDFESLITYSPRKEIEFLGGIMFNPVTTSILNYARTQSNSLSIFGRGPNYSLVNGFAILQTYINFPKIKGIASVNYSISDRYRSRLNPRIALSFPVSDGLNIRTFFGTAFRIPSAFYFANSFNVWEDDLRFFYDGSSFNSFSKRNNIINELQPEENTTFELGIRFNKWPKLSFDANFYYSKTDNIITFVKQVQRKGLLRNDVDSTTFFTTGYTNFGDSFLTVFGTQANIIFQTKTKNNIFRARLGISTAIGEKQLPGNFSATLSNVPEQPEFSAQLQLTIPFGKRWTVHLDNLYHGFSVSETAVLNVRDFNQFNRETLIIPAYYTLDVLTRFQISNNFSSYLQILNIFNAQYGGLSATGTPDDLFFNAQSAGLFRFGLSYNLD